METSDSDATAGTAYTAPWSKEGRVLLMRGHDRVECDVRVTRAKLIVATTDGNIVATIDFDDDDAIVQHQIELLPDFARRSRHQDKLFPFHLKPPAVARQHVDDGTVSNGADGVLLAVPAADQLWEWTVAIRWRGEPPEPEAPPRAVCGTTRDTNDHFDKPHVLQERLLMIGSYQPGSPTMLRATRFLWQCLVGACIFAAERNFEMLLSSGHIHLPDVKRFASFNTPLSMCCEGNYSPSRAYIAKTLIKHGHPVGRGEQAAGDYQFVFMLAKPERLQASSSVLGKAIHDDDKELIEFFIRHDDGVLHSEAFQEHVVQAAAQGKTAVEFNCRSHYGMTSLALPIGTHAWAAETLRELNLADNCLTTISDAVYFALPNLEALDVSNNCLWSISPAVKQMERLVSLKAHSNLIEALPDELEFLEGLTTMTCHSNPIKYPPKSVALAGAETIKAFFAGVRKHGRVTNTDLKVLVVGLSEAGKTSLINAVVASGSHLVRRGDRTVGIEQKRWTFEQPDPAFATAESPAGQRYVSDDPEFPFEFQFGDVETDCTVHFVAPEGRWMHNQWVLVMRGMVVQADPHDLTDCTWDPEARHFEGEVVWQLGKIANAFEKARFEFSFSEDFNKIEQGEIKWYFDQNQNIIPGETTLIQRSYSRRIPALADVNCLFYDFAGQQEYYSSHHIFLTERALYILAFDLTKYSAATFGDQVLFWANAIQERVPGSKVVVVGTHADELPAGSAGAVCDKVATALRNIRRRAKRVLDRKCRDANAEVRPLDQIKQSHARSVFSAQTGMPIAELEELCERKRRGLSEQDAALLQELDEINLLGGPLSAEETRDRDRLAEIRAQYGDDPLTGDEKAIIEKLSKLEDEDDVLPPADNAKYVYLKANLDRWKMMHRQLMEVPDKVFAVSSAAGLQGMAAFVDEIKATVLNRRHFPELGEYIPTYYTQVRRAIYAKRQEREFAFMKLGDYLEMMSTELGIRVAEVKEASEFMHILGEVLYYPELDVIFLKVQFLIDAFKYVIRHDHADATIFAAAEQGTVLGTEPPSEAEAVRMSSLLSAVLGWGKKKKKGDRPLKLGTDEPIAGDGDGDGNTDCDGGVLEGHVHVDEATFQAMKDSLVSVGDLHRAFLECLWAPVPPDGLGLSSRTGDDNGMFAAMVALLEKFEIAGTTARNSSGVPTRFLVPEFEPLCLPDEAWPAERPRDQIQALRCYQFDFSSGPPRGLMQRVQIKLCSHADGAASVFARDGCRMALWGCDVRLRLVKGANPALPQIHGLEITVRGPAAELDAVWRTCNSVVELVDLTLEQWPGVPFETFVVIDAVADGEPPAFLSLNLLRHEQDNKLGTTSVGGVGVSIVELVGSAAVGTWEGTAADVVAQRRGDDVPAECHEGTEPTQSPANAMADGGTPRGGLRERRKSFSHDGDAGAAVEAEAEVEFTLERLLGTELELPAAAITEYAALLRESFKRLYGDARDDNILFYDDDGLTEAGISSRPHRDCLLGWVEACQLERRPLQVPSTTVSVDGID